MATAPKWTEDEDALLRKFVAEGQSSAMIAARMPGNRSRNSIIGRIHRLKINTGGYPKQTARRTKPEPQHSTPADRVAAATSAHVRALRAAAVKMRYAETSKAMQDTSGLQPLNVELLDLHEQSCRWPVTADLPHLFCGHTKQEGSSYCPHHHAMSRTPVQVRRDQRPEPRRKAA